MAALDRLGERPFRKALASNEPRDELSNRIEIRVGESARGVEEPACFIGPLRPRERNDKAVVVGGAHEGVHLGRTNEKRERPFWVTQWPALKSERANGSRNSSSASMSSSETGLNSTGQRIPRSERFSRTCNRERVRPLPSGRFEDRIHNR